MSVLACVRALFVVLTRFSFLFSFCVCSLSSSCLAGLVQLNLCEVVSTLNGHALIRALVSALAADARGHTWQQQQQQSGSTSLSPSHATLPTLLHQLHSLCPTFCDRTDLLTFEGGAALHQAALHYTHKKLRAQHLSTALTHSLLLFHTAAC